MDELDGYTKDKLGPEVPTPIEVLLNRATSDTTNDYITIREAHLTAITKLLTGTKTRPKRSPEYSKLLILRIKHIRNHTERDTSTSRAHTAEDTSRKHHIPACAGASKDLPDVDSAERELHDRPTAKVLGPRRPQLATDAVGDQEPGQPCTRVGEVVGAQAVVLVEWGDGVGVDGRVEV